MKKGASNAKFNKVGTFDFTSCAVGEFIRLWKGFKSGAD